MLFNKKGMTLIEVLVTLVITMLLLTALLSFFIGAQRNMLQSRRVATSGQAVQTAMTVLRQELAGAVSIAYTEDGRLLYTRVRDEEPRYYWLIDVQERELVRINVETNQVVVMASNIDEFSFSTAEGMRILAVTVRSGDFVLEDSIYLRNTRN